MEYSSIFLSDIPELISKEIYNLINGESVNRLTVGSGINLDTIVHLYIGGVQIRGRGHELIGRGAKPSESSHY